MTAFIVSAALLFFVLGSLALALPWCGVVHLVERLPASARPSPHRYALLLIVPVVSLLLAVAIALGPWDAGLGKAIHEGCLHHIRDWNLPPGLVALVGAAVLLSAGRLAWAYGVRRARIRTSNAAMLATEVAAKWRAVSRDVERLTGSRPPDLVLVESPAGVCALRGGLHPSLLIHVGLLRDLEHDELVGAVCHEVAHAKHGDLLVGPVLHLCYCLLSFFPAARHCYAKYLEERELAADAWAVGRTGNPLALAAAIAKASRHTGVAGNAEARVGRLLGERARPGRTAAAPALAWALSLVPVALAASAGPTILQWHRILERLGRSLLLATGVIN